MPIIRIRRSDEYANSFRDYKVMIDGAQAGIITNGETKEFQINPGTHQLSPTIDWCSSGRIPVRIENGEIKNFRVASFAGGSRLKLQLAFFYALFGKNRYLKVEATDDPGNP